MILQNGRDYMAVLRGGSMKTFKKGGSTLELQL